VSQATPVLRRFARDAEQAVHLVIHDRNILVVVAQVDGPGYWNVSIRVGSRIGLVNTGSGHVFLAFASEEERALMLEDGGNGDRRREKLPPQLLSRLAKVREQGHEIMQSLQVESVTNLSVPIFGPLGSVIAALTCPYTKRLDKQDAPDQAAALKLLIATGHEISQRFNVRD
jgi:DNA-binding IclR family transcriptional regulator